MFCWLFTAVSNVFRNILPWVTSLRAKKWSEIIWIFILFQNEIRFFKAIALQKSSNIFMLTQENPSKINGLKNCRLGRLSEKIKKCPEALFISYALFLHKSLLAFGLVQICHQFYYIEMKNSLKFLF